MYVIKRLMMNHDTPWQCLNFKKDRILIFVLVLCNMECSTVDKRQSIQLRVINRSWWLSCWVLDTPMPSLSIADEMLWMLISRISLCRRRRRLLVSFVFTWISLDQSPSRCHGNRIPPLTLMMMWNVCHSTCLTARPKSSTSTGKMSLSVVPTGLFMVSLQMGWAGVVGGLMLRPYTVHSNGVIKLCMLHTVYTHA